MSIKSHVVTFALGSIVTVGGVVGFVFVNAKTPEATAQKIGLTVDLWMTEGDSYNYGIEKIVPALCEKVQQHQKVDFFNPFIIFSEKACGAANTDSGKKQMADFLRQKPAK
jgi:hypothetical protein